MCCSMSISTLLGEIITLSICEDVNELGSLCVAQQYIFYHKLKRNKPMRMWRHWNCFSFSFTFATRNWEPISDKISREALNKLQVYGRVCVCVWVCVWVWVFVHCGWTNACEVRTCLGANREVMGAPKESRSLVRNDFWETPKFVTAPKLKTCSKIPNTSFQFVSLTRNRKESRQTCMHSRTSPLYLVCTHALFHMTAPARLRETKFHPSTKQCTLTWWRIRAVAKKLL